MTDESLFAAALALPAADRAAFLAANCPDPAVRKQVEELLAAADASNPLDQPVPDLDRTNPRPPSAGESSAAVGDRVGPYKLLEKIGEGGMGEVWVADQLERIKRRVALKLIKPGMDSRSVLGRFEAERQALAVMDHPNIAKVLDAGTTPDGRPYFVMELVKGTPITEFADARKLTTQQRLELFVPVCQAIQHAHMKGIIHRDIKPSNVLVALHDETPVPKVIDFGVAKAVGQQLTEKTIYTGFGALVGTPAYMAPEQATFNQLDVDTRADVYALGVLLYELLAGSPPIERERLKKAALDEVLRIVRDEEPPRPSQRLSTSQAKASIAATRRSEPAKLSQLMKGELDWIVMKALEKDRTRRYETANGFAADVQRYLSGEPVLAVPPSVGYQLAKAYRRNKAAVLTAATVALALLLGIVGTTWGMLWAVGAERQARTAKDAEADQRKRAESATAAAQTAEGLLRAEFEAAVDDLIDKRLFAAGGSSLPPLTADERPYHERLRDYFRRQADTLPAGPERTAARVRVGTVCARLGDFDAARAAYDTAADELRAAGSDRGARVRLMGLFLKYRAVCDVLAAHSVRSRDRLKPLLAATAGGPAVVARTPQQDRADALTGELINTAEAVARSEPNVAANHLLVARHRFERIARIVRRPPVGTAVSKPSSEELVQYEQDLRAGLAAYRTAVELTPREPTVLRESNVHLSVAVLEDRLAWLPFLPEATVTDIVAEWLTVRMKTVVAADYPPWEDVGRETAAMVDRGFQFTLISLEWCLVRPVPSKGAAEAFRTRILAGVTRAAHNCPEYRYATALLTEGKLEYAAQLLDANPNGEPEADAEYRDALRVATVGKPASPYHPSEPLGDYARQRWIQRLRLVWPRGKPDAWTELKNWQREVEAEKPTPDPARLDCVANARVDLHALDRSGSRAVPVEELVTTLKLLAARPQSLDAKRWASMEQSLRAAVADVVSPDAAEKFLTAALNAVHDAKPAEKGVPPRLTYDLYTRRGMIRFDAKRTADAVTDFKAALDLGPDQNFQVVEARGGPPSVQALEVQCGLAHVRLGQFAEAEAMFDRGWVKYRVKMEGSGGSATRPDSVKTVIATAQEYYLASRYTDAALWYDRAAVAFRILRRESLPWAKSLAPSLCRRWGMSHYMTGEFKEAIAAFDELLELLPEADRPVIRLLRARATARLGDHAAASKAAKEVLTAAGTPPTYFVALEAAVCYSFCASAARKDATVADGYATESVRLLRVCAKADPKETAKHLTSGSFDFILKRDDFKTLAAELEPKK